MINDRMKMLINAVSNGNKRAFSQLVGVTPTVLENIVGTRQGKPGYDLLEKTAFAIENLNTNWLLTGRGSMFQDDQHKEPTQPIPTASSDAVTLRLMDKLDEKEAQIDQLQRELREKSEALAVLKSQQLPESEHGYIRHGDAPPPHKGLGL